MFNYKKALENLQNTSLEKFDNKIDIVYVLFFYKNIECLVDQLLNIYFTNNHYNFRIYIIINRNSPQPVSLEELEKLELPKYIILGKRSFIFTWGSDFWDVFIIKNYRSQK